MQLEITTMWWNSDFCIGINSWFLRSSHASAVGAQWEYIMFQVRSAEKCNDYSEVSLGITFVNKITLEKR